MPNQSECASPSGTGPICIETEKFCDGHFDCVNDEYTEYCGKMMDDIHIGRFLNEKL